MAAEPPLKLYYWHVNHRYLLCQTLSFNNGFYTVW